MNRLHYYLITQRKRRQHQPKTAGFTLIEILVALIIAALIITPLLGFMLNILTTDRREQAKASTEQELQAALDYITRDLEQSVYIYDAKGIGNIKNQLPTAPANMAWEPVLVFWKRQIIPDIIPIGSGTNCASSPGACDDAFVYSLVSYFLTKKTNCSADTWSCTAQIRRFETRGAAKDLDGDTATGETVDPGFNSFLSLLNQQPSPSVPGDNLFEKRMNSWQKDTGNYLRDSQVLIDYIDQTTSGVPAVTCSNEPGTNNAGNTVPRWEEVPASTVNTDFQTESFVACVDPSRTTAKVSLRGNALARIKPKNNPPTYSADDSVYFPTASIQVQGRGFVEDEEE